MLSVLRINLPIDPPIASYEINPQVLIRKPDNSVATDDVDDHHYDGYALKSRWFRSLGDTGKPLCTIHRMELATLQCLLCLKAGIPESKTYHCTTSCFVAAWPQHKAMHRRPHANGARDGDEGGDDLHYHSSTNHVSFNGGKPQGGGYGSSSNNFSSTGYQAKRGPGQGGADNGNMQWVEIAQTRAYTPSTDDVGHTLKFECIPFELATSMPLTSRGSVVFTSSVIQAPEPIKRRMVPVIPPLAIAGGLRGPGGQVSPPLSQSSFTILSFNVLADLYATSEMYHYCAPWALSWPYRRQNLLNELVSYGADILCLQEVQSDHFEDFFAPELLKRGYIAVYKKKTGELYTGSAYAFDGCATFFRRDRFALVKKYEVEFNKAALSLSEALAQQSSKKAALNRLLKDNVALIVVLEALDPPDPEAAAAGRRQLICVANTHIHANPELKDVKLWQVHTLLKGLEKIAASADIPMLVGGDFNSMPGSAPHSLLATGRVDPNHPELAVDPLGILRPPTKLHHQLPLESAYASLAHNSMVPESQRRLVDPVMREPLFTNYTKDFTGTLDYIFYTSDSLQPSAVLELVDEDLLRKDVAMPSPTWSSDHIAVLAEFRFKLRGHEPQM